MPLYSRLLIDGYDCTEALYRGNFRYDFVSNFSYEPVRSMAIRNKKTLEELFRIAMDPTGSYKTEPSFCASAIPKFHDVEYINPKWSLFSAICLFALMFSVQVARYGFPRTNTRLAPVQHVLLFLSTVPATMSLCVMAAVAALPSCQHSPAPSYL